jgi:hypothetical protein
MYIIFYFPRAAKYVVAPTKLRFYCCLCNAAILYRTKTGHRAILRPYSKETHDRASANWYIILHVHCNNICNTTTTSKLYQRKTFQICIFSIYNSSLRNVINESHPTFAPYLVADIMVFARSGSGPSLSFHSIAKRTAEIICPPLCYPFSCRI